MPRQGLLSASGTVLSRKRAGEGGLRLMLLLKGQGLTWASAPGAERGRVRLGQLEIGRASCRERV